MQQGFGDFDQRRGVGIAEGKLFRILHIGRLGRFLDNLDRLRLTAPIPAHGIKNQTDTQDTAGNAGNYRVLPQIQKIKPLLAGFRIGKLVIGLVWY